MKKKIRIILLFSCIVMFLTVGSVISNTMTQANADFITAERFGYSDVKYKMSQIAPQNKNFTDNRKGLRLYTYESGATAIIKGAFSGGFNAEVKASTENSEKPDLVAYSFIFTNLENKEKFSLSIEDSGTETNAYLTVEGEKTGVYYNVDVAWDGKTHGYTTVRNLSGAYTRTLTTGTTSVCFDPILMEVSIKNMAGNYITVWNLTQETMDGKYFSHVLESMCIYTVSLEFTTVKSDKRGDLTIYSINGEDYGKTNLGENAPTISVRNMENAILGSSYTLPVPNVYDYDGKLTKNDVEYEIYDEEGNKEANGKYSDTVSFTPTHIGNYYLYYSLQKTSLVKGESYVKFKVYAADNISCEFEPTTLSNEILGVNSSLKIPARKVESNLYGEEEQTYADIIVKKDTVEVSKTEAVEKTLNYTFSETGNYQIVYCKTVGNVLYTATPILVEIKSDIAGIVMEEVQDFYTYGTKLIIPEADVYIDGTFIVATSETIYPDGNKSSEKIINLNKIGNYSILYRYNANDKNGEFSKNFSVRYNVEDLFSVNDKATVKYDETTGTADMSGVLLTMAANSAVMTYDVDLSDNTKDDTLIELLAVASMSGVHDMSGFYVTLTDKLNRDNYITVRVYEGSGNAYDEVFVKGKAYNQSAYTGWYKSPDWNGGTPYTYTEVLETAMNHNAGGFLNGLNLGMNTFGKDLLSMTLCLKYDASEKAIYCNNDMLYKTDATQREKLVVDFDDPSCFSNLWGGFTDDSQVELKITPIGVASKAVLKISEIDGYKFSNKNIEDDTPPTVVVDTEGMTEIPAAKTNAPYKIFGLIVNDDFCEFDLITTSVSVFYGNTETEIENGYFIPTKDGYYTIKYMVKDAYGNQTIKTVEVEARSDISDLQAVLDGEWDERILYGNTVILPDYSGRGGSGKYYYYATVIHNGREEEIADNSFTPFADGEYVFNLYVDDYVGQTAKLAKTYTVSFESEFLIEDSLIVLPPAFIDGTPYVFENYQAGYYSKIGSEIVYVEARIEIEDANGTVILDNNRKYTPKADSTHNTSIVKFIFEKTVNGRKLSKTITKIVAIQTASQSSGFMANYFLTENAEVSAKNQFITFEAQEQSEDLKATFIRSVSMDEFIISFKANSTADNFKSNFDAIKITLTDKLDSTIKLELLIAKNGAKLAFSVNGGCSVFMPSSLTESSTQNIQIIYNNKTYELFGAGNSSLGLVTTQLNGKEFKGFTSHEAFVSFELMGVNGESAINLISINNQRFFNTIKDTGQPQIYVDGSYSGMFTAGTEITLPQARAYDVLSYTSAATITVKGPNGEIIRSADGIMLDGADASRTYTIVSTEIGRYTVSYTSSDLSGQTRTLSRDILIYDDVLPTIELASNLPVRVWMGTKVMISNYTVIDNGDINKVSVQVFYRDPDGNMNSVIDNSILMDKAGKYVICFYLIDENGIYNIQTYTVESVQKQ